MMLVRPFVLPLVGCLAATVAAAAKDPARKVGSAPPVAVRKPYTVESPNGNRVDPYYWLRDDTRSKAEVIGYLKAENAYYDTMTASYRPLTERLTREIIGRVKQNDDSVPYKYKSYMYFYRYVAGNEYPVYLRRGVGSKRAELLVDGNAEAKGRAFYSVGDREISANEEILAFTEDTGGRRQYTLRFRDIKTGHDYPERITGIRPGIAWANDNKTLYYVENDPVTLLSTRVKKHVLGTDAKADPVVYEEKDDTFYLWVEKSGDDRFVKIVLESTVANEYRAIDADKPDADMVVLAPRQRDVLYTADHMPGRWIVRTDWEAPNFRLMSVADGEEGDRARWRELFPYDSAVFIDDFRLFKNAIAIGERSDALFEFASSLGQTRTKPSTSSPTSPPMRRHSARTPSRTRTSCGIRTPRSRRRRAMYDVDMRTGERTLLKRRVVVGYDQSKYETERVWATARDGTKVPVSLAYRKGFKKDGTAPLYQYAYGSYGASSDPEFDSTIISLLDRGFVYALAHIRGGQEMGRAWYDDGKLLKKKNTFTDFIDVTDYLVKEKYAAPDKVFAQGLSAGGLLMGAVANMAPAKYRGIVAHVPYVDAVTTMLDETIPLTTNEFDEWGNPKEKKYYDYMMTYSPYDNVSAQAYPAMLVTTAL